MSSVNGSEGLENTQCIINLSANKSNNTLEVNSLRKLHPKPFKLRFGKQNELGKSNVSSIKPAGLPPIVTSKFYSKELHTFINEKRKKIDTIEKNVNALYAQGPRQNLILPQLESHKYGWYHNCKLSDKSISDRRFNFGIQNTPIVKYRLLILASETKTEVKRQVVKSNV